MVLIVRDESDPREADGLRIRFAEALGSLPVRLHDLVQKPGLASMAGMPHLNDSPPVGQAARRFGRVVADGNQPVRLEEQDEFGKKLLADSALVSVVGPVAEGVSRSVRMQGEDIPQKNR